MRFGLSALFGFVTGVALFCGIVFALPIVATAIVLAFLLWISPAVWITGAVLGQGGRRAFFLGGLICGIAPFTIVAVPMGYVSVVSIFEPSTLASLVQSDQSQHVITRLVIAAAWLLPGVFSFSGGLVGWLTYRWLQRTSSARDQKLGKPSEYRLLSARVRRIPLPETTTAAPE